MENTTQQTPSFTSYQKFAIFILAITQFSVILDFMVMSPLGDILMKSMQIKPSHFGLVVSAYAFSAGISGLLTAGFADKFDRKKLLLFFYTGFILGTILCGVVTSYPLLVAARIITGLFGGVIGSISMAIVTDLFSMQQRGRVMGFIQMAFGASQIFGIPVGLYIATKWDWHAPFLGVAVMAIIIAVLIALKLKPLTEHLAIQKEKSAFQHLIHTITKREYRIGFAATAVLSVGGFMLMPFGSAFAINNLKITEEQLPFIFMIAGMSTLIIMPVIGKLSDKIDKFKIFAAASIWTIITVAVYTNLGETPFWLVAIINILMMMGVMSRMVPSTALVTSIPAKEDRGAFMSINSSLQQISGGIAAAFAGTIVVQKDSFSPLEHYNTLGFIIIGISLLSILLLSRVNKHLKKNPEQKSNSVLTVSEV
ncbi:Predicted arabinose efflux permease, MFS family [Flavobacterium glycines]|uniref:MFS transporter n=1 Tax=Flavobacterium glycines TaxID=551990 RepID=A0A1B9DY99_9FLAO|nr:MFS transporter [Flavobacterium glycines]OCB74671.1 MFS transporter [Flavobacterium glycines]GEL09352.1 MFS transporter [Flavobacterium glycines]SDJ10045.1 Predicted arabinose efflux permease, MFS family [Flavobacterium glycines]